MEPTIQWKALDGKIYLTKEKAEAAERKIRFLELFPDGFFMFYKDKKSGVWGQVNSYTSGEEYKWHYLNLLVYLAENPGVVLKMATVV